MSEDFATLGMDVDSSGLVRGRDELGRLTGAGGRAERGLAGSAGRIRAAWRGVAKVFAAVGGAAAVALTAMTVSGLRAVDAQAKLATSVGGTVNGLQNLRRAADLAGLSHNQLDATLQRMTRRISLAEDGTGPAADALDRLGLSAANLNNLDVDERLDAIVSRINEMIPAAERAGVASAAFGEEVGVLIGRMDSDTIAQATQDIRDFGVAVTDEMAANIESANDAVTRMGLVFEGLRNQLASEVAPILLSVADRFNEFARSDAARAAIDRLVDSFAGLVSVIGSGDFLEAAIGGLQGLASVTTVAANGIVAVAEDLEIFTAAATAAGAALAFMGGPITLIVGALAAAGLGIATLVGRMRDQERASYDVATAQDELNEAMRIHAEEGTEATAAAAQRAAESYREQARGALEAAEAELALRSAQLQGVSTEALAVMREQPGFESNPMRGAIEGLTDAQARVDELRTALDDANTASEGLESGLASVGGASENLIGAGQTIEEMVQSLADGIPIESFERLSDEMAHQIDLAETELRYGRESAEYREQAAMWEQVRFRERLRGLEAEGELLEGQREILERMFRRQQEATTEAERTRDAIERVTNSNLTGFNSQVAALAQQLGIAADEAARLLRNLPHEPEGRGAPMSAQPGRLAMTGAFAVPLGDPDGGVGGGGGGAGGGLLGGMQRLNQLLDRFQEHDPRAAIEEWHSEAMAALNDANLIERGMMEDHNAYRLQIEQTYQDQLAQVRQAAANQQLKDAAGFFGAMASVAQAGGDRMIKVAQAFSAIQSLINAWTAYTEMLKDPSFIGRPWARFAAAASVLAAGLNAVKTIKSAGSSSARPGSSGGAAASGGGSGGGAAQEPQGPRIYLDIQPNARGDIPMETFESTIDTINEQLGRGGRIVA